MKNLVCVLCLIISLSSCKKLESENVSQSANAGNTVSSASPATSSTEGPLTLQDIKQIVIVNNESSSPKGLALDAGADAGIAVGSAAALAAIVGAFAYVKLRGKGSVKAEEETVTPNPLYNKGSSDTPHPPESSMSPNPKISLRSPDAPAAAHPLEPLKIGLKSTDEFAVDAQWVILERFKMIQGKRGSADGIFILEDGKTEADFFPVAATRFSLLSQFMKGERHILIAGGGTLYLFKNSESLEIWKSLQEKSGFECGMIGAVGLFCKVPTHPQ